MGYLDMETIKSILSEEDYDAALARVSGLMDILSPPEGQVEDDNHPARVELEALTDLVECYEDRHYPIAPPTKGSTTSTTNGCCLSS